MSRSSLLLRRAAGVVLLASSAATLVVTAPSGAGASEGSAVTVRGTGPFADLAVTVSKTSGLRNEVVQVTWTGAKPTRGNFAVHYLQVFQCWGDAADGPDREQCQFGGLTGDTRGGAQVASRQVTYDIVDPQEALRPQRPGQLRFVPFRSVSGKVTEAGLSEFFDASTTNEVPFAATRVDGGGVIPFEVQTAVEAPGLGCGTPVASGRARGCWLVVVPRGDREVDGSQRSDDASRQLLSSPLSASNWAHRVVVPLDFLPVGQPCPIGRAERSLVGHEQVVEAVSSWQPALCADGGPVYSYSQVPDAAARRQAVSDSPVLALTTRPVPAAEPSPAPVHAPVALSGVAFAFNIEHQSAFSAPPEVKARNGQPVTELNLTPRLVAKLLTQSYKLGAASQDRPGIERNPLDLTRDPEFLRANAHFRQLRYVGIGSVVVPAGMSDAAGLVWQWVLADPEASAFLRGTADPDGMVVNPAYRGTGQQDAFPKSDSACQEFLTGQPPLCTLDAHPYAADNHEAARGAARGDTLARSTWDSSAVPPVYRKSLPQPTGSRAVIALADTATALRYGLATARLRNGAGAFVPPTDDALLAAVAAMRAGSVADVLLPEPATKVPGAYPLAALTYAVTTPAALDADERRDYAAFLRHAAGPGQVPGIAPGQLPPGYAPLPAALRAQAAATATRIAATPVPASTSATAAATAAPTAAATAAPHPTATSAAPVHAPLSPAGGPGVPVLPGAPIAPPAPQVAPSPPVSLVAGSTPRHAVGAASRYAVVATLAAGGLSALLGSSLRRVNPVARRRTT